MHSGVFRSATQSLNAARRANRLTRSATSALRQAAPVRCRSSMAESDAPQWKQMLQQALKKNKGAMPYAKYYQNATLRTNGRPANRTVVHRGFHGDNAVTWITDKRSTKVEEVKVNPWCEAAWYFENSREQFRLGGELTIVGPDHSDDTLLKERKRLWSSLSPGARQQFTGPTPGLPRDPDNEEAFKKDPPEADSEPLDVFCLVVHDVEEVDYLSLKQNRHIIFRSSAGNDGKRQWTSTEVNP